MKKDNNGNKEYTSTIEWKSGDLTPIEELQFKKMRGAVSINELANQSGTIVTIYPRSAAVLKIHNPKSNNPDYSLIIISDVNGYMFYTGSETFTADIKEYFEVAGDDIRAGKVCIDVIAQPSKNYKDRNILMAAIRYINERPSGFVETPTAQSGDGSEFTSD